MDGIWGQLLAAFTVGLLGGVHCMGMCGGIAGALGLSVAAPPSRAGRLLLFLSAYNLGRLFSYAVAGALAGAMGAAAADLATLQQGRLGLQFIAGLFMLALGLYLGGWWFALARLEQVGGVLWRRIEPFARRLLPVRGGGHAFVLGLVWGWLPCGLVYTALIWSLSAGSVLNGAALMLAFGLGTLPNLMAMGLAGVRLGAWLRRPWVRRTAGGLVVGYGLWLLLMSVSLLIE